MSAPIAKNQFTFELPNLTYVDTSLEEASLRAALASNKPRGLRALAASFRAWREKQAAVAELEAMTDRELTDIGLTRADRLRVFNDNHNGDLNDRLAA